MTYQRDTDRIDEIMLRHPDPSWECYLCGEMFESEMSKDMHMTRCMAADYLDTSPDIPTRTANRFPPSQFLWNEKPQLQPPNNAPTQFTGGSDNFSEPVGPRRETNPPPMPPSQEITPFAPVPFMRRQIQYPPQSGSSHNRPMTKQPDLKFFTESRAPLFQGNNIQNNGSYRPQFVQTQNPPPISYLPQTPPTQSIGLRPQFLENPSNQRPVYKFPTNEIPPNPHQKVVTYPTSQGAIPIDMNPALQRTQGVAYNAPTPANGAPNVSPHQPRTRSSHSSEPSAVKLLSTGVSHQKATAHPGARRADKLDVMLIWEKQQPTLETELEYFDGTGERIIFKWNSRKEIFLAEAKLTPGEHSGSLMLPDTDKLFEVRPFNVSPHSVGVQEIRVELVDIAVKNKPVIQQHFIPKQGREKAATHHEEKVRIVLEPPVLNSQHRPPFQQPLPPRQEERQVVREGSQRNKSNPFIGMPAQERETRREVPHTPPYQSLPPPPEGEQPLPFQTNSPKDKSANEKERNVPQPAQTYREEERAQGDPHRSLPPQINVPQVDRSERELELEEMKAENKELSRMLEGVTAVSSEKERKLQIEAGGWRDKYKLLEESKLFADKENAVLKRETDQLKIHYTAAMTKLNDASHTRQRQEANSREVEELKTSLLRTKEEMDRMKAETMDVLQKSEAHERDLAIQNQELLEKLEYAQTEKEGFKKAAYRYRDEREKYRANFEEMTRAYGESKQKYNDAVNSCSELLEKLEQTEEKCRRLEERNQRLENELSSLNKIHRQNSNELGRGVPKEKDYSKLILNFHPVRMATEDMGPVSLESGSLRSDISMEENKRVLAKKTYPKTPDENTTSNNNILNPYSSLPSSLNTKDPSADSTVPPERKASAVLSKVKQYEQGHKTANTVGISPRSAPRTFRTHSNSTSEGVERYRPEILTVFINKTTPLFYKSSPVKTTNLSFLKKPDSHKHKQVFVKIKDVYRLGYLEVVFLQKHPYLNQNAMIAGIRLQEPAGNSNGMHESMRYFECEPNHAIFISVNEVYVPIY